MSAWSVTDPDGMPPARPRRALLQWVAGLLLAGGSLPGPSLAQALGEAAAFDLTSLAEVLAALGGQPIEASALLFSVPDAVEDGAFVPVEVRSGLPDTRAIYLLSESNPYPLVARFDVPEGTEAFLATRIRVQASCRLYAVVRTRERLAWASTAVRITRGGCSD